MGEGGEAEKTNPARKPVVHLEGAEWPVAPDDDRYSERYARPTNKIHARVHQSPLLQQQNLEIS